MKRRMNSGLSQRARGAGGVRTPARGGVRRPKVLALVTGTSASTSIKEILLILALVTREAQSAGASNKAILLVLALATRRCCWYQR